MNPQNNTSVNDAEMSNFHSSSMETSAAVAGIAPMNTNEGEEKRAAAQTEATLPESGLSFSQAPSSAHSSFETHTGMNHGDSGESNASVGVSDQNSAPVAMEAGNEAGATVDQVEEKTAAPVQLSSISGSLFSSSLNEIPSSVSSNGPDDVPSQSMDAESTVNVGGAGQEDSAEGKEAVVAEEKSGPGEAAADDASPKNEPLSPGSAATDVTSTPTADRKRKAMDETERLRGELAHRSDLTVSSEKRVRTPKNLGSDFEQPPALSNNAAIIAKGSSVPSTSSGNGTVNSNSTDNVADAAAAAVSAAASASGSIGLPASLSGTFESTVRDLGSDSKSINADAIVSSHASALSTSSSLSSSSTIVRFQVPEAAAPTTIIMLSKEATSSWKTRAKNREKAARRRASAGKPKAGVAAGASKLKAVAKKHQPSPGTRPIDRRRTELPKRISRKVAEASANETWTQMEKLLEAVCNMDPNGWFQAPVDWPSLPGYLELCPSPMDLLTVWNRMVQREYKDIDLLADDVRLTFRNCWVYNAASSAIVITADRMACEFEKRFAALKDRIELAIMKGFAHKKPEHGNLGQRFRSWQATASSNPAASQNNSGSAGGALAASGSYNSFDASAAAPAAVQQPAVVGVPPVGMDYMTPQVDPAYMATMMQQQQLAQQQHQFAMMQQMGGAIPGMQLAELMQNMQQQMMMMNQELVALRQQPKGGNAAPEAVSEQSMKRVISQAAKAAAKEAALSASANIAKPRATTTTSSGRRTTKAVYNEDDDDDDDEYTDEDFRSSSGSGRGRRGRGGRRGSGSRRGGRGRGGGGRGRGPDGLPAAVVPSRPVSGPGSRGGKAHLRSRSTKLTKAMRQTAEPNPGEVDKDMTFAEKSKLAEMIQQLPPDNLRTVVQIIQMRMPHLFSDDDDDELNFDIDAMDTPTLRHLERFAKGAVAKVAKAKTRALQPGSTQRIAQARQSEIAAVQEELMALDSQLETIVPKEEEKPEEAAATAQDESVTAKAETEPVASANGESAAANGGGGGGMSTAELAAIATKGLSDSDSSDSEAGAPGTLSSSVPISTENKSSDPTAAVVPTVVPAPAGANPEVRLSNVQSWSNLSTLDGKRAGDQGSPGQGDASSAFSPGIGDESGGKAWSTFQSKDAEQKEREAEVEQRAREAARVREEEARQRQAAEQARAEQLAAEAARNTANAEAEAAAAKEQRRREILEERERERRERESQTSQVNLMDQATAMADLESHMAE